MEYWDVYDKKGKWKRRAIRKGERLKNDEYHIIVEGWILRDDGNFIIQRRALDKKSFAGWWFCYFKRDAKGRHGSRVQGRTWRRHQ